MLIGFINTIGNKREWDNSTNAAVSFTNWISIIIICSSIGCTLLSYSLSADLVTLSWTFTLINTSSIFLIALGFFPLARYILNISPSLYLAILHIAIKEPSQEFITSILLIQIAVLSAPWIMFKATETYKLYSVLAINILFIISSVYLAGLNQNVFDNSIYTTGIGFDFGLFTCIFGTVIIISFVNWTNHKGQTEVQALLNQMEQKNQQMQQDQHQLKNYIRQVEQAQEVEKKRQWVSQNVAEITEILRTRRNHEFLYDSLISAIVKALDANQGGLFLVYRLEEEINLALRACYAYNRKKWLNKSIAPGEGLVGQCYLEKEILYLTDVPEGYTHITSGLGDATPKTLVIVPLLNEESMIGVIEIASFKAIEDHHIEYLESVSTVIGNFIYHENMIKKHAATPASEEQLF